MKTILIIGAGLSGLRAARGVAGTGNKAILLSRLPGRRAASGCAQGGINAALDNMGDGDTVQRHFEDTVRGGDYLADQPAVMGMCQAAPDIVREADALGALFNRLPDGRIAQRFFGGTSVARTCFAGASTGQVLLNTYSDAIVPFEGQQIERLEGYEFLSLILDKGRCGGAVVKNVATGELAALTADAVILATGGSSAIYGNSTNPLLSNGAAIASAYMSGATLANMEFVQFHPTAMVSGGKARLISEGVRGEGGRVWTLRNNEKWYFLEEMFPERGNLITRDKASQAIMHVCCDLGLGIEGKKQVYLDVTHLDDKQLSENLGSVLELYEKYAGEDPRKTPMRVYPAAHYFMGGLYVSRQHETDIPGLFACGECDYQYHGANRLGGNSLLSALYGGGIAGKAAVDYARSADPIGKASVGEELEKQREKEERYLSMKGEGSMYQLAARLAAVLDSAAFIKRDDQGLADADEALIRLQEELPYCGVGDTQRGQNLNLIQLRHLEGLIPLARAIVHSALYRHKSRGAHSKDSGREAAAILFSKVRYFPQGPDVSWSRTDTSIMGGPENA